MLFLICLYISSRALSEAFEHRNFVARYQRETLRVASLVIMDASLQYWSKQTFIYIINYISKRENDLWTLPFFDLFLPDEFLYRLYHSNTFVLLTDHVHLICWHHQKQKCRLTFLFCCFISALLRYIPASKFIRFAILSWTQDTSFFVLYRFNILHRQLIRISIRHFEYSSSNLVTT